MWRSRFLFLILVVACAGLCGPAPAADTDKPLTNADLLQMLGAGVPEGTILLALDSAGGNIQLDASPAALVALRKQGATEPILNAVMDAAAYQTRRWAMEKFRAARPPGLPLRHGVYYQGASGWISLPASFLWPRLTVSWTSLTPDRYRIDLRGSQARFQLADRRPTFYVSDFWPEGQWGLVRLSRKKHRRELRVQSRGVFPWDLEIGAEAYRDLEIQAIPGGVYTIRPKSELDPGEYGLCQSVRGARSLAACYEFGVTVEQPRARARS